MHRLELGMTVSGIRGKRLGKVVALHGDCFEVERQGAEGGPICLDQDALFTVEARQGVTLVCHEGEEERYRCAVHTGMDSQSAGSRSE